MINGHREKVRPVIGSLVGGLRAPSPLSHCSLLPPGQDGRMRLGLGYGLGKKEMTRV